MIEQVLGGGGGGGCAGRMCRFLRQFFRASVFFVGSFRFTDAFFESILQISAYFLLYWVSQKSNMFEIL